MRNRGMKIAGFAMSLGMILLGFLFRYVWVNVSSRFLFWGFVGIGGAALVLTLMLCFLEPLLPPDWEKQQLEQQLKEEEARLEEEALEKKRRLERKRAKLNKQSEKKK